MLIIPFSDNQGQYKFGKTGDVLEGPGHWKGVTATARLARDK